jgi:hypothetical protein
MKRGALSLVAALAVAVPALAQAGGPLTINGHVGARDGTGSPVALAGATVQLKTTAGTLVDSTTTDASGNYAFTPNIGSYKVEASKTGYVTQCRLFDQNGNPAQFPLIELPTPAQAGGLSGTVRNSFTGQPIQDVTVEVGYDHGCTEAATPLTTDSNGHYFFPSLPGPQHLVTFSKSGYNSRTDGVAVFAATTVFDPELEQIDVTDPRTKIRSVAVRGHNATVKFRATDPGPSSGGLNFTCRLDGHEAAGCESPKTYKHLSKGRHTVRVVAFDAEGNFDATPAKQTFRIG